MENEYYWEEHGREDRGERKRKRKKDKDREAGERKTEFEWKIVKCGRVDVKFDTVSIWKQISPEINLFETLI